MKTVSFESIRQLVAAQQTTAHVAQSLGQATGKAARAITNVTKSVSSTIQGVLPVTNNKLDDRTLELLKVIVATQGEVMDLRAQLLQFGFTINDSRTTAEEVNETAALYLAFMKAKPMKEEAPIAMELPVVEPQIAEAPIAPPAPVAPVEQAPVKSASEPNHPMGVHLSQPSNWHQQ